MMNIRHYTRSAVSLAAAVLLAVLLPAACTSADDTIDDDHAAADDRADGALTFGEQTGGIYIGTPPTRGMIADEPTADRILVRIYRAFKKYETSWHNFTPADMKIISDYVVTDNTGTYPYEKEVPAKPTDVSTVRMGEYKFKWQHHIIPAKVTYDAFAYTALAFRDQDRSQFNVTSASNHGLTMGNCLLTLTGEYVPELYFGNMYISTLRHEDFANGWPEKGDLWPKDDDDSQGEAIYYYRANGKDGHIYGPRDINGHLFRIVSQINVNITEVPARFKNDSVRSLELWGRGIAKQIGLWGHHGVNVVSNGTTGNYRIRAAHRNTDLGELFTDSVKLAEIDMTNNAKSATVKLSTFLLPSEAAQEIWLKVNYDSMNTKVVPNVKVPFSVCYRFRPQQSQYLTGTDANYDVISTDIRRHDAGSLYVYNAATDRYFSYSNVRVNLRGRFQDIVEPPAYTDLAIEVEPGFVQKHTLQARE